MPNKPTLSHKWQETAKALFREGRGFPSLEVNLHPDQVTVEISRRRHAIARARLEDGNEMSLGIQPLTDTTAGSFGIRPTMKEGLVLAKAGRFQAMPFNGNVRCPKIKASATATYGRSGELCEISFSPAASPPLVMSQALILEAFETVDDVCISRRTPLESGFREMGLRISPDASDGWHSAATKAVVHFLQKPNDGYVFRLFDKLPEGIKSPEELLYLIEQEVLAAIGESVSTSL